MLSRQHRLTNSREIVSTLRRGRKLTTPVASIHILPQPEQAVSRVAIIVSKKVHPSAVKRHQYQRWLRVAAAELLPLLSQPVDMVWVAHAPIARLAGAKEVVVKLKPSLLKAHASRQK